MTTVKGRAIAVLIAATALSLSCRHAGTRSWHVKGRVLRLCGIATEPAVGAIVALERKNTQEIVGTTTVKADGSFEFWSEPVRNKATNFQLRIDGIEREWSPELNREGGFGITIACNRPLQALPAPELAEPASYPLPLPKPSAPKAPPKG